MEWLGHIDFVHATLDKPIFLDLCSLLNTDEKNKVHRHFAAKEKWSAQKEILLIEQIKLMLHREIRPSDIDLLRSDLVTVPTDFKSQSLYVMLSKLEEVIDVGAICPQLSPVKKLLSINENSLKLLHQCSYKLASKLIDRGIIDLLNTRLENPETDLPLRFLSLLLMKLTKSSDSVEIDENTPLVRIAATIDKGKL